MTKKKEIKLGLKENWQQFTLLVIVNAFVGGMVGLERNIFPDFAKIQFGIASKTAILSFITAFGIAKAAANYYTGRLSNKFGRRNLLILGWLFALPVPFLLIYAPDWWVVIGANVLLGINQGLAWSSTVVMKLDLVGEKNRGLATGINEFSGYFAVGLMAILSGWMAEKYGIVPYTLSMGIVLAVIGLLLSLVWVKDTRKFVKKENKTNKAKTLKNVFLETTFKNKALSAISQAGLANNLNDGMIWGLLPIVLSNLFFDKSQIGLITGIYPAVWGIGQLFTGKMSDMVSKKGMLFWGMLLEGVSILLIPFTANFYILILLAVGLGLGTALVYPTFLAAVADATTPMQRAESVGTFRLWRDLGYAFGAIISGITADLFGIKYAVLIVAVITLISAFIIKFRMPKLINH